MTERITSAALEFDLRPDPRILPMLGEINLVQWRCLAELVDNSVDAFLATSRVGAAMNSPEVRVAIPTSDVPQSRIVVRDNGPGMDMATLEKAVRAGWTGNDPINSLGMFGMGFNIATARLGAVTRVWTTRDGDAEWTGLEIDFDRLVRQRHFLTPVLVRPKNDPHESGTEVSVERLKPEQAQWFARSANRTKLVKELGLTYSSMLRPNGVPISFRLYLNGTIIRGRDHCVWGGEDNPNREVQTSRYGVINAYQPVDVRLADRPFCARCWQWVPSGEEVCPACGVRDDVVVRQRRVYGWLGIQRYLNPTSFGIDFLRNGRKIEIANKDLFVWNDGETPDPEYPIDDPRQRGRIVGEIHIDHCRVMYTKDRFDRNDPAWADMVRVVRGEGPLRPDKAEEAGFGQNTTPLFLLFQAFRRSSPKPKVAGAYARLLVVPDNERAEDMAKRFYAGEPEYQTDAKWWELVEEADRELLVTARPPRGGRDPAGDDLPGFAASPAPTAAAPQASTQTTAAPPQRIAIPSLTAEYRDDLSNQRWQIRAYQVTQTDPELGEGRPWSLKATAAGFHELLVDVRHPVFSSATMTPLDALLAELAWSAMDFQRGNPSGLTFSAILASLRARYGGPTALDPVTLSGEAGLTLGAIARSLARNASAEDSRALFDELLPAEQDAIHQRMATRAVRDPQQAINSGRFLEFAPRKTLLRFFETHPELFFDGRYWDVPYATLDYRRPAATEEAQSQVVKYYASLLTDAIWLAEQDPTDIGNATRARLLRSALALELLASNTAPQASRE